MTKLIGFCIVVLAASVAIEATHKHSQASAESMPPALQKLTVLAGTWKANGQTYVTDFSKAGTDTSTLHNECWQSGIFYACDQIVDGDSKALIVFTPGEKEGSYINYGIVPSQPAAAGHLKIAGDHWTYGGITEGEKPPYWRTINIFSTANGATVIHYSVQFSKDGTDWTTMKDGVETKQP
jgi:hypothetical protein